MHFLYAKNNLKKNLERGGWTPLFSAAARRCLLILTRSVKPLRKQSGVQPPHSKKTKHYFLLSIVFTFLAACANAKEGNEHANPYSALGDILYWRADENGLGFAVTEGKMENPHFEWDFGFRLGLSYLTPHDLWKLSLVFTYLHTDAHSSVTAKKGEPVYPSWAGPDNLSFGTAAQAFAHWRLHLGLLDLSVKREFFTSRFFSATPYLGLRLAVARQKYNLMYEGGTLFPSGVCEVRMKNKFFGVGPLAGTEIICFLGKGFALEGKLAGSLLLGSIYVHQNEEATVRTLDRLGIHDRYDTIKAILDSSLGLSWTYKRTKLHLLCDMLLLFKQNQLRYFQDPLTSAKSYVSGEDLAVSGVTFGATISF